ncbi:MAG: hypothetical protein AB7E46_04100 [Desulfovibrio sp.]
MPDSYLENALTKLARQLVAFDEASLMDLWEKYAEAVRQFEPSRRWEEAALVFGLIQAVRMKNQLFNYNLAASRQPGAPAPGLEMLDLTAPQAPSREQSGARRQPARGENAAGKTGERAPSERASSGHPPARPSVRQGKPKAGKLIPLRRGQD